MSEFGKLLRAARLCQNGGEGWSYGQLAKRVEWGVTTLTRWEDGSQAPPGPESVMALCAALKIDPKPLMRAAVAERGAITLEVVPERVNMAAALAVAWAGLTQLTLDRIAKVISESKHG